MLNVAQINGNYLTTSQFSKSWFDDFVKFVDATEATIQTYKKALKQFSLYLSVEGITAPTREDILTYRDLLKVEHKPATVQLYIVALKQFFRWTSQEGLYSNIADHIKGAKISRLHKRDSLTTNQVRHILKGMERTTEVDKRNYAIFTLMVTAGLRTIEVSRANVEDLRPLGDFTVLYIQGKGKDEKSDYVKITPEVEEAIRDYLASAGNREPSEPLFTSVSNNSIGKRLSTRTLRGIIKKQFNDNGYSSDRLTAHSLRHTTATINLLNGGTLEETQQLLRHENISNTMIYSHHLKRINNNSEARVADTIFKSV